METRLHVLENRLRQTEETLVAERRTSRRRRTAKVAQRVVRTCPAVVDVEEIERLEISSMLWSQWSLTVRSNFGEINQTANWLPQRHGNKRGRSDHHRQHDDDKSGETTFNTAVLCASTDLQEESTASGPSSSQKLRVRGTETAVQEIWTASSGEIPWNAPSPLVVDEVSRAQAVGPSVEKQKKGLQGTVGRRGV